MRILNKIKFYLGWIAYHYSTINDRRVHMDRLSNLYIAERNYFTFLEYKRAKYPFKEPRTDNLYLLDRKISVQNKRAFNKMIKNNKLRLDLEIKKSELSRLKKKLVALKTLNK